MPRIIARVVESRHSLTHSACKGLAVVVLMGAIVSPSGSPVSAQAPAEKSEQPIPADSQRARDAVAKQGTQIIKLADEQIQELKKQADGLREKQHELRTAVRDRCGLSPENVTSILLGLERDRFTLEIEVKLKAARRDSLAQLVAREAKLVQERAGSDEILEHLNKVIEARRTDLARKKQAREANAIAEQEVKDAEVNLAEAQIRVAVRREELGKSHEDPAIDRLNQQLLEISVEMTQDQLRLELLKERLTVLDSVQTLLDDYKNTTEIELPSVLRLLEQAQTQLAQVKLAIPN
jgi:hypothetical protein